MSHDYYLWMSYAVTALAIIADIVALRIRRARAMRAIEEERELETED